MSKENFARDSISRTFPEQCVLVFCYKTPHNLFAVGTTQYCDSASVSKNRWIIYLKSKFDDFRTSFFGKCDKWSEGLGEVTFSKVMLTKTSPLFISYWIPFQVGGCHVALTAFSCLQGVWTYTCTVHTTY